MIKIFGHKSPDSDSTGSPLIWEWYVTSKRHQAARACLLGQPNKEALFMLDRWGYEPPAIIEDVDDGDEVILVDTNNPSELPASIGKAKIVEIIDHHLLQGGLSTREPINIAIRPVACTATVMHELMDNDASSMPDAVRGLMLTCILSDTMEFRSPTTTGQDHDLAQSLAADLDIDIARYAAEMFAAKSDLSEVSAEDIIRTDSKRYEIGGKSLRISVLETTSPSSLLERKDALFRGMEKISEEEGLDEVLFFVVDIFNESSTLLVPNDAVRRIAEKSFAAGTTGDTVELPGIVSRKKQIIPNLTF